ncbi:MAG TPA: glycosyltransferase family 39 protein [Bacteroidales bacterium]|nr:glycosyltransferase family 39 protein [Bacteroidales bacterium]
MTLKEGENMSRKKLLTIVIVAAIVKLTIHFLTNTTYGFHRDAYLYLAQSQHLSWGYISVPPLLAFVLAIQRLMLPDTVFALRLLPALIGVVNLFLIALIVRQMGGKKTALIVALAAYLLSPAFLRSNTLIQPVSFNQMFWLLSAYVIIKIIKTQNPKFWIWLGVIAGIGFLNKYSVVFFFAGFFIAIFLTRERQWYKTKYPWIALLIGFLIALPNLVWQYNHNWPVVHHMHELRETQLVHVEVSGFILMQLFMNISVAIVWIAGLIWLFAAKAGKAFRVLGWIYVFTTLILLLASGKPYYTLGLYPMLFAAGGMAIQQISERFRFVPWVLVPLMALMLIPILPFSIPVYSFPHMVKYGERASQFGGAQLLRWEDGKHYDLPQDYADMTGWEEVAKNLGEVYQTIPVEERKTMIVYADSYGLAGAILFYKDKYNLPEAVSFNGSFIFWMPEQTEINSAIYLSELPREESTFFNKQELKIKNSDPYARNGGYIYYLTEPNGDIAKKWNDLKKASIGEYGW